MYIKNETHNATQVDLNVPIVVEAAVYNQKFTENKLSVRYFRDLDYLSVSMNSISANLHTTIYVQTEFYWGNPNEYTWFQRHANFTCKYQIGDEVEIQKAIMETNKIGGLYSSNNVDDSRDLPALISCSSPINIHNTGKGKLWISVNGGADYSQKFFNFTISE